MARAAFNDTIASVAGDGTLKAIANVKVEVRKVSDDSLVTLWNHRTATAPANELGTSIVTGPSGLVSFYAEGGEYNITYTDLSGQNRIASPTTFGWDSVPGSQNPEALGFDMGDIKISSRNVDHGRWLRLDGRELTQTEIAGALSLPESEVSSFVAYMGTGSVSKYGSAASSKVKLPDARRRAWIGAGASGDTTPTPPANTTARNLGASGGAESVTLTKAQSGLPGHGHGVNDSGHSHSSPAHQHGDGSLATSVAGVPHTHYVQNIRRVNLQSGNGATFGFYVWDSSSDAEVETDGGGLATIHGHDVSGSTATASVTIQSNQTGVSVQDHSGADAANSHENMPPFVAVGYLFIRV